MFQVICRKGCANFYCIWCTHQANITSQIKDLLSVWLLLTLTSTSFTYLNNFDTNHHVYNLHLKATTQSLLVLFLFWIYDFFLESEIIAKITQTDEEQVQDIINTGKVKLWIYMRRHMRRITWNGHFHTLKPTLRVCVPGPYFEVPDFFRKIFGKFSSRAHFPSSQSLKDVLS